MNDKIPGIPDAIAWGGATDEELAQFFSSDLMNQLAAQWRDPETTRRLFAEWYVNVLKPIGIPPEPALKLFTGELTINDFVELLDETLLDTFLEKYPDLQAKHQARIDRGELTG